MLSDKKSFEFQGINVSYHQLGAGSPLLLLHGSGPGASSIGNWRAVLEPLARNHTVYAMDLVGFGLSDRKPSEPYFDFGMWSRQAAAMLERIPGPKVGLIGHSLSGAIALSLAAGEPRVAGVLTTGSMGAPFEPTEATRRTWTCPRNRDELVKALHGLVFNKDLINEAYMAAREPVLFAPGYAEYFNAMFKGDLKQYVQAAALSGDLLAKVRCPVLMLHGRDDVAFPPEVTLRVAQGVPHADVVLLGGCSHSVAFEHTEKFLFLAERFFNNLTT